MQNFSLRCKMPNKTRSKFKKSGKLFRKAQVEDWLPLLLIIFILIFIFVFISIRDINRYNDVKEKVEFQILSKDSTQLLINYLDIKSALSETKTGNIADDIIKFFATGDKSIIDKIKPKTDEYFSKSYLETDFSSWSMEINHPGKKEIIIESEESRTRHILRTEISKILIPVPSSNNLVEIKLFFVTTKFTAK